MIYLLTGIIIGTLTTWVITLLSFTKRSKNIHQQNAALLRETNILNIENKKLKAEIEAHQNKLIEAKMHIAAIDTENAYLIKNNEEKSKELEAIHNKFSKEFEDIANRILIDQSKIIHEQNHQKLGDILSPLKEKISQFEKKVEETYDKEVRDKLSLQAEVKRLFELNQRVSQETENLTRALKGDVKKLGNWGEVILERILEQSGLTKGREYRREVVNKNNNGDIIRPDVIIDLPENKHLIIDSKLSLIAYEKYINAQNNEEKTIALKQHKERLREHVKNLYEKNYLSAKDINSPDFVLMFIPVEASFAIAIENDHDFFAFAWDKKIVPVSPSTLLATLKTISSIWRQENQSRNAQEIARQSGALYDKLVGFIVDLEKIGNNIDQLNNNYSGAMMKLQSGKGNLISRAERIKMLGAKNNKSIPEKFLSE
jgi:DNA recombination protein RmuC